MGRQNILEEVSFEILKKTTSETFETIKKSVINVTCPKCDKGNLIHEKHVPQNYGPWAVKPHKCESCGYVVGIKGKAFPKLSDQQPTQ